jgi:hypothetical protein
MSDRILARRSRVEQKHSATDEVAASEDDSAVELSKGAAQVGESLASLDAKKVSGRVTHTHGGCRGPSGLRSGAA